LSKKVVINITIKNKEETPMNKHDLVTAMAKESKLTKKDAEAALDALITTVETAMKKKDKVTLVGFGTWEVRQRAARKGVNPRTKEAINIPATKVPVFKAGKGLKDLAAGAKANKNKESDNARAKTEKKVKK
jgi:DNA-binding protein HU-beta